MTHAIDIELQKRFDTDTLKWVEGFIWRFKNERLKRLIREVWGRLPAYDRYALTELVLEMNEGQTGCENTIASTEGIDIENMWSVVSLGGVKDIKSDDAAAYVIAHEFAHVLCRHTMVSAVLGFLSRLDVYADDDFENINEYHEDQADLMAWVWGFQDELLAFQDEFPEARRPCWFFALSTEEVTNDD